MRINTLQITVKVSKLLNILKENREKHKENYDNAVKKFLELSTNELTERLENIKQNKIEDINRILVFNLPVPVNYLSAYNEIINMLEFCAQEEIKIDSSQYNAWVEDKWDWSNHFLSNSACYNG